ncbi:MAG TPA: penicillin-binding protein 2 [Streptosporangiaceae bacterium]|jgi:peptidoglycan glycosyltransferase|nr:penicillin-binding protein 2 [Streptosporangiaceae bacterium]
MNRALRRISIAVLVMFVLLLANVNYLQAFEANSLASKPGNVRAFEAQYQYQRGEITTSDGKVIAESKPVGGIYKYQRYYPQGPEYAPVTGYDTLYSTTGIEQSENALLTGSDSKLAVRNVIDMITGKTRKGANVELTIDSRAQTAAYNALQTTGKPGAVVALDPKTGAILAMASYPSYDPNQLSVLDGTQLNTNDKRLLTDPGNPLLNRAIQATYPPGSTFKIVTSSALFSQGNENVNSLVSAPTSLKLPQSNVSLINNNGEVCGPLGNGKATIITAFTLSCNTAFANIGMQLGTTALQNMAGKFGMNSSLTIPMPVTQSNFPLEPALSYTALSAIGQKDDTVTPLQEAMLSAAIANNGTLMKPYLVKQVQAADLSTVQAATPTMLSQPVNANVAGEVKQMMQSVVNSPSGTAHAFAGAIPGVQIYGKTGTAQNGVNNTGLNDAVFTCFANSGNQSMAVGVIIQGGGYGASAAAPIAVSVLKAYLENG